MRKRITISMRNMRAPPLVWLNLCAASAKTAKGRRAMIPTIMIREIPLPIPLSVIRSPSHITNIVPAISTMVAKILNPKPCTRNASAGNCA